MEKIVCKFGGTSVKDAEAVKRAVRIVNGAKERRYVVVSAPGKTDDENKVTDELFRAFSLYSQGDKSGYTAVKRGVENRFLAMADEFEISEFKAYLSCLDCTDETTEAEYVSRGEYLTARLFAAVAEIPFVDAETLFYFDGTEIDTKRTYSAIKSRLSKTERAVIPGFYGTGSTGISVFPRGGGDISGAIIASAVNADLYENFTDVDGVYLCPPKFGKSRILPALSYRQYYTLASYGTGVYHLDAVPPVQKKRIPVKITNTFSGDGIGGTYLLPELSRMPSVYGIIPVVGNKIFIATDLKKYEFCRLSERFPTFPWESVFGGYTVRYPRFMATDEAVKVLLRAFDGF